MVSGTFDPLAGAARRAPRAPALLDQGRWLSYGDLSEQVDAWAARLGQAGVGPGQRVVVVGPPSADTIRALHAGLRTGAVIVPLHPGLTASELAAALRDLDPVAALGVGATPALDAAVGACRAVPLQLGAEGPELPPGARLRTPPEPRRLPGVAVVWTSGTSGEPRGVLLSAEGLMASARGTAERLDLWPDDRWLASLQPAHVGGLALLTRAALLGCGVVPFEAFDADRFIERARRAVVTHASLVPTQLRRVVEALGEERLPDLRAVLIGGAAADAGLLEAARAAGIPVAVTYGLTEATSQVATAPPEVRDGSVGHPLPGVEVAVDSVGEIRVRGATVAPGEIRGGAVRPLADADGWLATGDLGRLDDDGRLWITGRRSDRIISGGVNVDPAEVEAMLLDHPSVAEAAVVGVPDDEWGERVVAVVVPPPNDPFPGPDAVLAYLRSRLSGPKRPKAVRVVESLPRNANGKVDRQRVRRLFNGTPSRDAE